MPSWFGINDTNGQYRQSRARSEFRAIQGYDLDVSAGSHQTSGALVVLADRHHAADEFRAFPGRVYDSSQCGVVSAAQMAVAHFLPRASVALRLTLMRLYMLYGNEFDKV